MADRLALVFGGGGGKGAFGAGVLWGLVDAYPTLRWNVVSGTSTGALITPWAVLADEETGPARDRRALRELRDLYITSREKDIVDSNFSGLFDIVSSIVDLPEGAYSPEPLREQIDQGFSARERARLDASDVIAIVNAVDLQRGRLALWTQRRHRRTLRDWFDSRTTGPGRLEMDLLPARELTRAMLASSAIPAAIEPQRRGGDDERQLVDGGVVDLAPLRAAIAGGATHVLAVLMSPQRSPEERRDYANLIEVGLRSLDLLTDEIGRNDIQVARGVTEMRGLMEHLLDEYASLPARTKRWVREHRDRVETIASRTAVDVEVIEPHRPLGDTLDFNSFVREGWPMRPNHGTRKNIMHARFEYGRRRIRNQLRKRADLRALLERFVP